MSINKVAISGNVTRDPELRTTAGGTGVLTFTLAVNDRRKNPQTGEWEDQPNFIDCTVFGNRGVSLANLIFKGTKLAISGRLKWSSWEKDGVKRSKVEVIADEVELMQRPANQAASQAPQAAQQQAAPANAAQPVYVDASIYDEDIPF